jgi:Fur family transcriptional regulator, peroxide stress response regulator
MRKSVLYFRNELLKRGIHPSYPRIKIMEILHQKDTHPTADEIFTSLSPEVPSPVKATVYNTLHTFVKAGLVRVINITNNEVRYDITLANHGHFKCNSCGEIFNFAIDISGIPIDELKQFEVTQKDVNFTGLCPSCRIKNQE